VTCVGQGRVAFRDDAIQPEIELPFDALVKVTTSAICGTDIHLLHGAVGELPTGTVIGHEFVGTIVEVGPAVRRFKVGDRVVATNQTACGVCWYCRKGFRSQCADRSAFGHGPLLGEDLSGGQAEYVRVPVADTNLHAVPTGVTDEQALFVGDIFVTAYAAARNADVHPGDTVAVIGCGPVGLLAIMCADVFGAARIFGIDRAPLRLEYAERVGAEPLNSATEDAEAVVKAKTEGRGADAVIDCAGGSATLNLGLSLVRPRGTVSVVGVPTDDFALPGIATMVSEITIRFGIGDPSVAGRLMELMLAGRLDPTKIVSHRLPLEQAEEGYGLFETQQAVKVLLVP
jgi:threonine dehydrogenase-like Zn-dependent dehydrogenase